MRKESLSESAVGQSPRAPCFHVDVRSSSHAQICNTLHGAVKYISNVIIRKYADTAHWKC